MFKVQGSGGRTYNIYRAQDGAWVCNCAAWKFQRVPGNVRSCKHIRALVVDMAAHVALAS